MSNTTNPSYPTTPQGTPLPPQNQNPGQPQVPAGVPSSVPGATGTAAPAPTPVVAPGNGPNPGDSDSDKPKRRTPQKPPEGRIVSSIPPATKRGVWDDEMTWLKQNPGVTKLYENVAQTTPSYIKSTYGVMAYGRNTNSDTGRVDMYCYFDPEQENKIKKDKSIKPGEKAKTDANANTPANAPS